jgi:uncharacterized protein YheU (UPF0270 family)
MSSEFGVGAEQEDATGVEVPHDQLSANALRELIESFVNREGTDYGLQERTLEQKVADVLRQLENGEAVIVFEPEDESISIRPTGGS